MLKKTITNYSLVLLGNNHNPTILTDYFLVNSAIISDVDQIIKNINSYFTTPAVSHVTLKDGTSILMDPQKLVIQSKNRNAPFIIGNKYCLALPYVKTIGFGINFKFKLEINFEEWFKKYSAKGLECDYIKFKTLHNNKDICNVIINKPSIELPLGEIDINFDYKIEEIHLKQLGLNFEEEYNKNIVLAEDLLNKIFL